MEIGEVTISETVKKANRNARINILCEIERNGNFLIEAHREVCLLKEGKRYIAGEHGEKNYIISKNLSEIVNRTITLPPEAGGITLTVGQLALGIEMVSDQLALEEEPPDTE